MIDHTIDHAHRQAEAMERDAKAIDDRMRSAGVPAEWLNRRRGLGELRNPYGGAYSNLSVRAILEQKDRALAGWLAQREGKAISGVDYKIQDARARQAEQIQRLQAATARMREAREARHQPVRLWTRSEMQKAVNGQSGGF